MPITLTAFTVQTDWEGCTWSVPSVDELANAIAIIAVGQALHVANILHVAGLAATGKWMKTNPDIHAQEARDAHKAFSNEWKGLVRMVKYWNNNAKHGKDKPVKPSFLIEVMALQCLHGGWQGRFDYEMQAFFSSLADRVLDEWPDPAGLGSPVSDGMDDQRRPRCACVAGASSACAAERQVPPLL